MVGVSQLGIVGRIQATGSSTYSQLEIRVRNIFCPSDNDGNFVLAKSQIQQHPSCLVSLESELFGGNIPCFEIVFLSPKRAKSLERKQQWLCGRAHTCADCYMFVPEPVGCTRIRCTAELKLCVIVRDFDFVSKGSYFHKQRPPLLEQNSMRLVIRMQSCFAFGSAH